MFLKWFGNLVTMEWWTDLWLNEGFATYMQHIGLNLVLPDKKWVSACGCKLVPLEDGNYYHFVTSCIISRPRFHGKGNVLRQKIMAIGGVDVRYLELYPKYYIAESRTPAKHISTFLK